MDVSEYSVVGLNLVRDSRYFEHTFIKQEENNNMINDPEQIKQEHMEQLLRELKATMESQN